MPVADAINRLKTGLYAVTRQSPAAFVDGIATESADPPTVFSVEAVVFPVTGRELQLLPEGLRERENMRLICKGELRTGGATNAPDIVAVDGADYDVTMVERWRPHGFCSCVLTKRGAR